MAMAEAASTNLGAIFIGILLDALGLFAEDDYGEGHTARFWTAANAHRGRTVKLCASEQHVVTAETRPPTQKSGD
jgi:hypothetical protein